MDFGKAYTYITEDADWVMKVVIVVNELSEVPKPYKVSTCLFLEVLGCVAECYLIAIQRDGATTGERSA